MSYYCGIDPKVKRKRGTAKQCLKSKQIRYYGIEKISPNLINRHKTKLAMNASKRRVKKKIPKKISISVNEWDFIGKIAKKEKTFRRDLEKLEKLENKALRQKLNKNEWKFIEDMATKSSSFNKELEKIKKLEKPKKMKKTKKITVDKIKIGGEEFWQVETINGKIRLIPDIYYSELDDNLNVFKDLLKLVFEETLPDNYFNGQGILVQDINRIYDAEDLYNLGLDLNVIEDLGYPDDIIDELY